MRKIKLKMMLNKLLKVGNYQIKVMDFADNEEVYYIKVK